MYAGFAEDGTPVGSKERSSYHYVYPHPQASVFFFNACERKVEHCVMIAVFERAIFSHMRYKRLGSLRTRLSLISLSSQPKDYYTARLSHATLKITGLGMKR